MQNKHGKIYLLACLGSLISLLTYIYLTSKTSEIGDFNMQMYIELAISVLSGMIPSLGLTIFMYYKFLKKIPQETHKTINTLLNERLNHETTNHNTIMQNIIPSNASLSKENGEILTILKIEKEKNSIREKYLTNDQKDIKNHLQSLQMIVKQMENLQLENCQLKEKINELQQENSKIKNYHRHYDKDREIEIEI